MEDTDTKHLALRELAINSFRAGDLARTRELLQQVVSGMPSDWQAWNMLGAVEGMLGQHDQCETCCRKVIDLQPAIYSTYNNLGNALKFQHKIDEARQAYAKALELNPNYAEALNNLGNLEREQGNLESAEIVFTRAIAIKPGYAQAYNNLGNVYRDRGLTEKAITAYRNAANAAPEYADAWINLGVVYQLDDRIAEAIACYRQVLSGNPENIDATFNLGSALLINGETNEAETCFRRVLRLDSGHANARYFLASILGDDVPEKSPKEFVTTLFDTYAEKFDEHLVKDLEYQTPSKLRALFDSHHAKRENNYSILDLGCGTGLSGAAFADHARNMDGIDLSPKMIEKARARNIYDNLEVADLVEYLSDRRDTYDLVLAADVFVYIGDLANIFRATHAGLKTHGVFCFSVERHKGKTSYVLRNSGRYAHSPEYVESLAHEFGFTISARETTTIRKERGSSIQGELFTLSLAR